MNVGESYTLPNPTPPAGSVDHIGTGRCTNKSDCIAVSGLDIKVYNYYTGTATIEVEYNYTYIGTDKKPKVGNGTAYYSVKCKPTEVKLSKTSLELEVGDVVELSYSTSPSGLEPEVEWKTSDTNVAKIEGENRHGFEEAVSNVKKITVWAVSAGTCVIKLNCNTGYTAPTCTIKVKEDNRPHLTADIASGSVKKGTKVTLTCDKAGADIRYTTDGSAPTKSSLKYNSPIVLNESITLKAIAFANGQESEVLEKKYTVVAHDEGEIFTYKTVEGVALTMKAFRYSNGIYLQVGEGKVGSTAIDKNYTGKITIPTKVDEMDVRQIAGYAFDDCKLSSVSIPEINSFRISPFSFRRCPNLKEIRIPNCVIVAQEAFKDCSSLETIVFSRIVIFNNSLQAAIMSNEASNVFSGCNGIIKIYSNYDNPYSIKDDVFPSNVYTNATLYVPQSAINKYKSTNGWKKFKNIKAIGDETNKKLTLTASPAGGEVAKGSTVILTAKADGSTVSGCDIYFTTNGNTPSKNNGTKYTSSGITINSDCTIKAIAYKDGYETSDVLTATYTVPTPKKLTLSASPSGGQVSAGTKVTLTAKADGNTVSGCDIYYTTNGNTPSKNNGTKYTSSGITINSDCTIKAIAFKDGYETSDVLTATYTVPTPKKLTLSASPSGGQVSAGTKVTLTAKADGSTVSGCDIYYTTNGNTPSKNNGTKYTSSGITINSDCTIKAIAYKDGYETSNVLTATYTTPKTKLVVIASPSSGQVEKGTTVKLYVRDIYGNDMPGDIYYTLNGSTPSKSSTKYYSGITINSDCTLKAIAYKDGYETSDVLTATYTTPKTKLVVIASPSSGQVEKGTTVKLYVRDIYGNDMPGDIYYTLNGSTPSKSSTKYYSGITINNDCTLKAIAYKDGYETSDILTTSFTIAQTEEINIDATNFPDANFRNWILSQSYGADGKLTASEISSITFIYVSVNAISSLKGIEHFTSLEILFCNNNQLTSLDVSKNTALTELYCYKNQLTSLDVSKNTTLTSLWCDNNQLTSLDVSKNTALTDLICYENQLTSLDVTKNTALFWLSCWNNRLTSLDVSKNTALKLLYCSANQLTSLDVSENKALTTLDCYDNQIRGAAMDALINSLPQNQTADEHEFSVIDNNENDEGNVCTIAQVAAAKAKGWRPLYWNGKEWTDYEGSDEMTEEIEIIELSDGFMNSPREDYYDLHGRRMSQPAKKGIYIRNGKKVLVR